MMNRVEVLVVGATSQVMPQVLPALRLRSDVAGDVEQAVELSLRSRYDLILLSREMSSEELIRSQELFGRLSPEARLFVVDLEDAEAVRTLLLREGKACVRRVISAEYEIQDNPLSPLDEIGACQI